VKTLRDIGEDALIERLITLAPRDLDPAAGPGDDCAIIDLGASHPELQLLKTDALVEHIHFLPSAPAEAVGWKAVARVVSDFAAMGGRPGHFLVTLALTAETEVEWVEGLYRGIGACLKRFGGILAGGETSSVPAGSAAVISIAATGWVSRGQQVRRSMGKPGDSLFVTGLLGGSITGKHLNFIPRIVEANWLVSNFQPSAMMDLSDGLAKDLPRLAKASGCGFRVDEALIPLMPGCTVAQGMGDGEDYEMLIAIDQAHVPMLVIEWAKAFPELALTRIGELVELGVGQALSGGWEHFQGLTGD
jgi:thiamine-monophosphate kinase